MLCSRVGVESVKTLFKENRTGYLSYKRVIKLSGVKDAQATEVYACVYEVCHEVESLCVAACEGRAGKLCCQKALNYTKKNNGFLIILNAHGLGAEV